MSAETETKTVAPEAAVDAPAPAAAPAAAEAATTSANERKLFVRGLSLSTRELALARHIETVAPVEDVRILMSFNSHRSKGSAFVTLKNADQVDEVVKKLNGVCLDGRYLEIQRAKPLSELPRTRIIYAPYPPPPYHRYGGGNGGRFYRRGGYSSRGGRSSEYRPAKREAPAPAPSHPSHPSHPARAHQTGPNPNRTLSQYTVAVQNLPFVAKESDMEDIFEDFEVLSPKICRTRTGLSKGVAFVTFPTHEDQQRAIETADSVQVEGRQIHVVEAYLLPEELEAEKKVIEEYSK